MVSSSECCICYEKFNDNEDNTSATSCKICNNKICIRCYDKTTELRMEEDKFYKIVNNCCICRIETEKKNFNEFSKEQLGWGRPPPTRFYVGLWVIVNDGGNRPQRGFMWSGGL